METLALLTNLDSHHYRSTYSRTRKTRNLNRNAHASPQNTRVVNLSNEPHRHCTILCLPNGSNRWCTGPECIPSLFYQHTEVVSFIPLSRKKYWGSEVYIEEFVVCIPESYILAFPRWPSGIYIRVLRMCYSKWKVMDKKIIINFIFIFASDFSPTCTAPNGRCRYVPPKHRRIALKLHPLKNLCTIATIDQCDAIASYNNSSLKWLEMYSSCHWRMLS